MKIMIESVRPLSTQNLGSVFALNKDDFKHIKARVKVCITSKNAVEVISRSLPAFRGAVAAAEEWTSWLSPELNALATELQVLSAKSIASFSSFCLKIDAMGDEVENLPTELKEEAGRLIDVLNQTTAPIYKRFEKVNTGLLSFIKANTDLDVAMAKKKLGFETTIITANLNRLQEASGHVKGGWQGLYEELQSYANMKGDIDIAFLEALQMKSAISGWEKLSVQCSNFLNGN